MIAVFILQPPTSGSYPENATDLRSEKISHIYRSKRAVHESDRGHGDRTLQRPEKD